MALAVAEREHETAQATVAWEGGVYLGAGAIAYMARGSTRSCNTGGGLGPLRM